MKMIEPLERLKPLNAGYQDTLDARTHKVMRRNFLSYGPLGELPLLFQTKPKHLRKKSLETFFVVNRSRSVV